MGHSFASHLRSIHNIVCWLLEYRESLLPNAFCAEDPASGKHQPSSHRSHHGKRRSRHDQRRTKVDCCYSQQAGTRKL